MGSLAILGVAVVAAAVVLLASGGGDASALVANVAAPAPAEGSSLVTRADPPAPQPESRPFDVGAGEAAGSGSATREAQDEAGPPSEGIKVSGAWTIDVFDPDGTLVQHVEFENALRPSAADYLARALNTGATWGLQGEADHYYALFIGDLGTFDGSPPVAVLGASPCTASRELSLIVGLLDPNPLLAEGCYLVETDAWTRSGEAATDGVGTDLVRDSPRDETGAYLFRASGSVVATRDGVVDFVESFVWKFNPPETGVPPIEGIPFTATGVAPLNLVAGQAIQVVFEVTFN